VDRHGLSALAMTRCGKESRLQFHDSTYLSLRGGRQDDAAIHRVSGEGDRVMQFAPRFTVDHNGLRPRDDKVDRHSRFKNKRFYP
jgi:hypothetical protein